MTPEQRAPGCGTAIFLFVIVTVVYVACTWLEATIWRAAWN